MTPMTAAMIVAAAANTAAVIALLFARREITKAEAAISLARSELLLASSAIALASSTIASVRASRASRLSEASLSSAANSAFAQASASCRLADSGRDPNVPLAISRSTSKGPIDRQSSSSDWSMGETPNVANNRIAPAETGKK